MGDLLQDPRQEYDATVSRLTRLRRLLKVSGDGYTRKQIAAEIQKLEAYVRQLESLYSFTPDQGQENDADEEPAAEFPIHARLADRYNRTGEVEYYRDKEARAAIIYMRYFEKEFLGLFNKKILKLDVEYSISRDSFYGKFQPIAKAAKEYGEEYRYIETGELSNRRKHEMRGRLLEKKHYLLVQIVKYFRTCLEFAEDLLEDIDTDGILCMNGSDEVSLTAYDGTPELHGHTVRHCLQLLQELSAEVIGYMNLPEFD
jgi:hypothetical protein